MRRSDKPVPNVWAELKKSGANSGFMSAGTRQTSEKYVLYVNKSYRDNTKFCKGSESCLRHVQQNSDFLVQDIDEILRQGIELPSWLDGSPILVEVETGTASKGSHAVKRVAELVASTPKSIPVAVHSVNVGNSVNRNSASPPSSIQEGGGVDNDDPFNQNDKDSAAAAEASDRGAKKVDERALEALIAERQKTMESRAQPPSNALPPPLPATA